VLFVFCSKQSRVCVPLAVVVAEVSADLCLKPVTQVRLGSAESREKGGGGHQWDCSRCAPGSIVR